MDSDRSDMASPRLVVLHSGGLDSSVCLLLGKQQGFSVVSLGIDYGQRHRVELQFAERLCERLKVPRRMLRVEWDKPRRELPLNRRLGDIRAGVSPAFLPGRNLIFISLALAEAVGVGAKEVWIGVNDIDFSGYPDCRPSFIEACQLAALEAIPDGPRVSAPLMGMSKPDIARLARRLGLQHGETWSCYRPELHAGGVVACGKCDACVLEQHAWSLEGAASEVRE